MEFTERVAFTGLLNGIMVLVIMPEGVTKEETFKALDKKKLTNVYDLLRIQIMQRMDPKTQQPVGARKVDFVDLDDQDFCKAGARLVDFGDFTFATFELDDVLVSQLPSVMKGLKQKRSNLILPGSAPLPSIEQAVGDVMKMANTEKQLKGDMSGKK